MPDAIIKVLFSATSRGSSESLIPYPAECLVYAFLVELIKTRLPQASEEERHSLLAKGVPRWQMLKQILAESDGPYTQQ